jgi:hypothetical protein
MSQNSTDTDNIIYIVISYIPLAIIFLGLLGNTLSFLIFSFNKEMNRYSSMIFLSFIAVIDTIGLFIWNLDHFLQPNFNIYIEKVNLFNCKFFTFLQYFTLQSSGFLYTFISIDRYFAVMSKPGSRISQLPFGTTKSTLIWSICILIGVFLFNTHLLVLNGYYENKYTNYSVVIQNLNRTDLVYKIKESLDLTCYAAPSFNLWPLWDVVHIVVHTFIPFIIMAVFNTLLIMNGLLVSKQIRNRKKLSLTISLTVITLSFVIMTAPANFVYGFYNKELLATKYGRALLTLIDSLM